MSRQTLIFGGDFTLGKDPAVYMKGVNALLDGADFRMFQLEEPFLDTLVEGAPPERLTKTLDVVLGKVDHHAKSISAFSRNTHVFISSRTS